MNPRSAILRLVGREYLPMAGSLLTWAIIIAAVGHADGIRLLTSMILVRATRALTKLDTATAMRRRHGSSDELRRASLRQAVRIELASLGAAALVLGLIVALLVAIGQIDLARMTALVALGLPARHFAPAMAGRRAGIFQTALAWSGAGLVGAVALIRPDAELLATTLGIREWIALAILFLPHMASVARLLQNPSVTVLTWSEVVAITARQGRHRLTYRVGRIILGLLGPFGGALARTARGLGVHRRMDRFSPDSIKPVVYLTIVSAGVAVLLPFAIQKPATMLASASLLRVAGAAGSVLLWWRFMALNDHLSADDDDED